jgi:hypothetical protein
MSLSSVSKHHPSIYDYPAQIVNILREAQCPRWHRHAGCQIRRCEMLSHQWTQYSLRILWTFIYGNCNITLAWKINFFRICMKACLAQSISSDVLGCAVEYIYIYIYIYIFYIVILFELFIPSPNVLVIRWSHTILPCKFTLNSKINPNFVSQNTVSPFFSTVDIILIGTNVQDTWSKWSKMLSLNCSRGVHNLC